MGVSVSNGSDITAYSVWYWIGSAVAGSIEGLRLRTLWIDNCEVDDVQFSLA